MEGKTIVVSGVGMGLGRAVALAASRAGANVVLGARTEANLKATAEEVSEGVAYAVTDILDRNACRNLIAVAAEQFGSVDALVNVAAKEDVFGGLADADLDAWRATLDANVIGTMQLTQAALPELEKRFFDVGVSAAPQTPAEFVKFVKAETAKWQQVVAEAKIAIE